ncbi:serine-rich adhesin for platelets [Colletes gigas]|uniref:serine-rich adhesin for platelets n=1 Tax=Colletes gigas TaxID=935657 RepID=UPI001C9B5C9F|nr:serine-rich adhesin for platelets [Colletes gigas]
MVCKKESFLTGTQTVSLFLCLVILLATIQHGNAERKIVCYYTNWSIYRPGTAKFSPQNINPYLCTHLIYAFGGFTKDNALKPFDKYQDIEKGGYAKFTGLKTYNKNLKTMLAIGGWNEGSSRFSPMVADQERRREFVKNSIKFLRKNHFDGLDLDWEYPAFRDGGKPRDKDNYANLVQELREEFDRESSKTGRPRLLLSLAMPAGIEYVDKGYDVPRLNEYLDFINLLSYDYHSSYEPAVNHHSPLYPLEEDNEYNYDTELTIDYTIEYLLKKGASPEKIILGIPTYGRSYTLFNQDATELGSPADGPGIEGDATREKGYLAYYEICESLAATEDWEVIQPNPKAMGPYAFKGDQWVGYDDEDIVKLKAKYVNEKNLGGIMFWTIDNDDFRGKCHDRPYPLIEAAKETLLSDSTNTVQKSKTLDNRKKTRVSGVQSNTVGRKQGTNRRSTTTAASATRKRVTSSPRPKFRTFARPKASVEEEEEKEVDRRSYDPSSDEEEEEDGGNAVRTADKSNRSREKSKSRPKRPSSGRNRRKQNRHKGGGNNDSGQESLSNKLTTPEPPTTPDPGTDFKCEDEGFFSHPRDCKKYFWCLDAGPGGLGVVAHQFTCPSGLVFNKAADSCDYPRNVVCPKSKTTTVSTTRAPITAATSRTTYLYSSTRKPTTEKPDSEEEYEEEYEDDDEIEEEDEEEEEEVKEEPKVSSTLKPLLYKTITRNRPTTTTTTTTTEAPSTTSKSEKHDPEKVIGSEDEEEDPKVIKELIMLIKKAGGIEELEKQLFIQNKSPDETSSGNEPVTPATISRTLYERVLNRQAGKSVSRQRTSTNKNRANGPGGAQFEGLDEVPEVKTLRRTYKPQYVTIERPKSSTKEPPVEDEELNQEEDLDDDTADVASSEEQSISNPFLTSSTQRATPNYINIRRARPSSTTSRNENDVDEKDEDTKEQSASVRSRRPNISSKSTESNSSEESKSSEESSPTTKSRYINIQRFRSTTPKSPEVVSETISASQEPITESVSSEAPKIDAKTEAATTTTTSTTTTTTTTTTMTPSTTTTFASSTVSTTSNDIVREPEMEEPVSSTTTETVKLVEDSATEILLTTAPASLSTLLTPNAKIGAATVSHPRPFGFSRRNRPADTATTPLPASNDQTRPKVSISSRNHTRSSFLVGRGRLRPRQEPIAEHDRERPSDAAEESSQAPGRTRQRGSSRYTPSTYKTKTEETVNSVVRERTRVTEAARTTESASESPRRRFRRPSARATGEHPKANELEDSPIVRITQSYPRRSLPSRSRSATVDEDEAEKEKITNIKVFKKPTTVNRDVYARTKYTRKRNNAEEQSKETEDAVSSTAPYSSTVVSTTVSAQPTEAESPPNDPITEEPYANSVDELDSAPDSTTTESSVETNTVEPIRTTESIMENEVVTVTPDDRPRADEEHAGVFTTTNKNVVVEDFDPDVIRIVFPTNVTDQTTQGSRNATVPRRRKVLLRKRPVASSTVASQEEEENRSLHRRRKVVRRLRPVQNTTTATEVSSTEQDQVVLRFGYTVPNEDIEEESVTKMDVSTEAFDTSTAETSRTIDYTLVSDFASTFETTTVTPIDDEVTTASTMIDNFTTAATELEIEEPVTETAATESTASSFSTEFDETSEPSSQPDASSTPSIATQTTRRLEPYNRTYYLDSRYVRKKFVRRRPVENVNNAISRNFARPSSTTERSNTDGASKRRKSLFVRRRPVTSTTARMTQSTENVVDETTLGDEKELRLEEHLDSNDATLRIHRGNDEDVFAVDLSAKREPEEFWSRYVTPPSTFNATEDEAISTGSEETYRSTLASNRKPEYRPRYRVPNSLRKTVSTEGGYDLDSSLKESEEASDSTPRQQQNFRQPRTRYQYRDEEVPDATQSPSFDSSTHVRSRFYARRPVSSTTELSVTETLIPAKKFDYVADAHRRQQSLRTTPRGPSDEDTTTLRSLGDERQEVQNLVDTDYVTTPPPKPLVTRLVTSVEESATTERQKILIKTKYSSLTSTTRIPLQTTAPSVPDTLEKSKDTSGETNEDETANEIRQSNVERSTLPIESEFLHRATGWLTTESHESSTIEIESVFSNLIGARDSGQTGRRETQFFCFFFPSPIRRGLETVGNRSNGKRASEQPRIGTSIEITGTRISLNGGPSLSVPPSSDFQVANSEAIRLPTLKELIGYRTNDRAVSPSPVYLSLLDKRANLVLEEDAAPGESVPSLAKVSGDFENRPASVREPWTLEEIDQSRKGSDAVEAPLASGGNELDLLDGRASAYYVEDNIADNEDDGPTKNKKRIDRQDSSTTTPRPTTMRGPPLATLFQSQIPRGFYVTRSETDPVDTRKTGNSTTEPSTLPTAVPTLSMGEVTDAIVIMVSTSPSNTEKQSTVSASINSTINDEKSSTAAIEGQTMRVIGDRVGSTTPSINREETETETNLAKTEASPNSKTTIVPFSSLTSSIPAETDLSTFLHSNEPVTRELLLDNSPMMTTDSSQSTDVTRSDISEQNKVSQSSDSLSDSTSETLYTPSMTRIAIDHTLESTTETELNTQKDSGASSEETSTTNEITDVTTQSVQDGGNFTMDSQDSITTPSTVAVTETTVISRTNRRRQKIKFDSVSEFGRRANRNRDRQSVDNQGNSSNETRGQQQSGRPVPAYRRRQRRPSTALNDLRDQKNRKVAKTVETKANNSAKNSNDQETSNEGETDNGKKLVPNAIETKVHGEQLPEVNSSKSTVMTTRTPGSPLSTRLRKPTTPSSTSSQNKPSNTLANNRKNRPTDGSEKLDATNNTPELPKSEKDIDQSSRAQEIAVTLAEPPTPPQSATTGRPSLRNALRRRISTTLAPRTDATQSRTTTVRFAPVPRDRQRPKTKDKPQQNVTTRPRRPQVIDYDYYEDEEEPVVGKSTYNGKLFLTSKGTIRCLDQGNFPHPYSCKKFITCAKMVNGQVVGAEYTCPDKLSYDPVGGICNWSAGLGCKE